jgi:hypothetical protein
MEVSAAWCITGAADLNNEHQEQAESPV